MTEVPGITWGDNDSIGKQMLRIALQEKWYDLGRMRLRVQVIDGVEHWDYFQNGPRLVIQGK